MLHRHIHSTDLSHKLTKFGINTATGPLRRHLYENHTELWLSDCERFGIEIKAKEVLSFIQEFRGEKGAARRDPNARKLYSNEAFVDAIVEFVVGDDQVSVFSAESHSC